MGIRGESQPITRRQLIVLGGAFALAGCSASRPDDHHETGVRPEAIAVDAGPLAGYAAPGIYGQFRTSHAFFIVREGDGVFAQSAICTHRDCLLSRWDGGFRCRCHGSTFTADGHVTRGPARRDLPRYAVEQNAAGHLIVHIDRPLLPHEFDGPGSKLLIRG